MPALPSFDRLAELVSVRNVTHTHSHTAHCNTMTALSPSAVPTPSSVSTSCCCVPQCMADEYTRFCDQISRVAIDVRRNIKHTSWHRILLLLLFGIAAQARLTKARTDHGVGQQKQQQQPQGARLRSCTSL